MREFVMGDIHGCNKGLKQCLERSKFDFEKDLLISLGDIVDGWSESYECVETLLKIKNLISIRGNHDWWWYQYILGGIHPSRFKQGALSTLKSYGFNILGKEWKDFQIKYNYEEDSVETNFNPGLIPEAHKKFFTYQHRYYLDSKHRLFIHAGINRHIPLTQQIDQILLWDRDLWYSAVGISIMNNTPYKSIKTNGNYNEIYLGHTTTINWNKVTPMNVFNIWNLDTGAGFKGKLTIMDINTKEYWQSDFADSLYPNEKGR